ncbi:hypothetical protein ACHHYP_04105 [Achlya hypogyna]|uniref:Anaphase-promoting complex subunit 4-like WD40 domain-containing protein n=1 Tax=Achlya hypogyna TaxID=1202772 RepID=A0A1V9Z225_ACHHY|nr:hypothetical protein ACHHYP_04105 [Achlya hypogyna]
MGNQSTSPRKSRRSSLQGMLGMVQGKPDEPLEDHSRLTKDMFTVALAGHHCLPPQPSLVCYVPQLELAVVSVGYQQLKVYGQDGLEMFVSCAPETTSSTAGAAGATATFLQHTGEGRIVLVSSDSGVQVVDLTRLQSGLHPVVSHLLPSWTTCRITALETFKSLKATPFFFLALDDGSIQVVHEDSCEFATYAIAAQDLGLQSHDEQCVAALASNPADLNQLLITYDGVPDTTVYLWDLTKQKVIFKITAPPAHGAIRSLAWHAGGKRFAAGFQDGSFGLFRADKAQAMVFPGHSAPLTKLQWVTTDAAAAGVLACVWAPASASVVLYYPPKDMAAKDALSDMTKLATFAWRSTTLAAPAPVMDIVVTTHVAPVASVAPFTALVLAGDPMGGVHPRLDLYPLPCVALQPLTPKEELVWLDTEVAPVPLPSAALQATSVVAMDVIDLGGDDGALRDELFTTCEAPPAPTPVANWASPLRGGRVELVQPRVPADARAHLSTADVHRSSLLVTAQADATLRFWELVPRHDGVGAGVLSLLHTVDLGTRGLDVTSLTVTCVRFDASARLLLVGMDSGEVVVFSFQEGFQVACALHVHSNAIEHMAVGAAEGYIATSDAFGVVAIVHLDSQDYKLAVFDISTDEMVSVDALHVHAGVLFVGRGNGCVELYDLESADLLVACQVGDTTTTDAVAHLRLVAEDGAPILPPPRTHDGVGDVAKDIDTETRFAAILATYTAPLPPTRPIDSRRLVHAPLQPGPLGLFLVDDLRDRICIQAFTDDDANAAVMAAHGVVPQSTLVAINGVSIVQLTKDDAVALLAALSASPKMLTFELPAPAPYLLVAKGRTVALFKAETPAPLSVPASPGAKSVQVVDVDASVDLRSRVAALAVCSVPVDGRLDHAIVVVDDSGFVYVLVAPSLRVVWSAPLPALLQAGYAFDYVHIAVSRATGDVLLSTAAGDLARFAVLAKDTAGEMAMLQWTTAKSQLCVEPAVLQRPDAALERKNSSIFKVWATADVDLNKVFVVPPKENLHLRGDKLADLGEKTERLKQNANEFYHTMKAFNERESKKKWYQI